MSLEVTRQQLGLGLELELELEFINLNMNQVTLTLTLILTLTIVFGIILDLRTIDISRLSSILCERYQVNKILFQSQSPHGYLVSVVNVLVPIRTHIWLPIPFLKTTHGSHLHCRGAFTSKRTYGTRGSVPSHFYSNVHAHFMLNNSCVTLSLPAGTGEIQDCFFGP